MARQSENWREIRRLRAWALYQSGWQQSRIAEALGVTQGAVSQWITRARGEGAEALHHHKGSGRPPELDAAQKAQLVELLREGAQALGFRGEVWHCGRVATLIERAFGVRYHPAHVSRLLRALGGSLQKPLRRAAQRDEAAIAQWLEARWPVVKKTPRRRARR